MENCTLILFLLLLIIKERQNNKMELHFDSSYTIVLLVGIF